MNDQKYFRTTKAARHNLVMSLVAYEFHQFSGIMQGYRGSAWTPDSMERIIQQSIERQYRGYAWHPKHLNETISLGWSFYLDNFDAPMRALWGYQTHKDS